jgi:6-phosphogluconolactonase/glucosamine-6-phosphate isomerase/deaminase
MEARKLVLIANGKGKAQAIKDALEGPVGPQCPASYLKYDSNCFHFRAIGNLFVFMNFFLYIY